MFIVFCSFEHRPNMTISLTLLHHAFPAAIDNTLNSIKRAPSVKLFYTDIFVRRKVTNARCQVKLSGAMLPSLSGYIKQGEE